MPIRLLVFSFSLLSLLEPAVFAQSGQTIWKRPPHPTRCSVGDRQCLEKFIDMPEVNLDSISSIQVKCAESLSQDVGMNTCTDFLSQVESGTRDQLSAAKESYYRGKFVDWDTGDERMAGTPVCNLNAGEVETNFLGSSCGPVCTLKVSTGFFGGGVTVTDAGTGCTREYSWIRGAYSQAKNHFYEEVLKEISNKTLRLVDYDGVKPCAGQARELVRGTVAFERAFAHVAAKSGPLTMSKLNCSKESTVASQTACKLFMANKLILAQWQYLAACEITARAQKEVHLKLGDPQELIEESARAIEPLCSESQDCVFNGTKVTSGACEDSGRTAALTKCYEKNMPEVLRKKFMGWWPTKKESA